MAKKDKQQPRADEAPAAEESGPRVKPRLQRYYEETVRADRSSSGVDGR